MFQRPFFLAGLVCLLGTAAAFLFSVPWTLVILVIIMLFSLILFPEEGKKLILLGGCGVLTCLVVLNWQIKTDQLSEYAGETVQLKGYITAVEIGPGWVQGEACANIHGRVEQIDLVSYSMEPLRLGQQFRAVVELEEPDPRYSGFEDVLQGTVLELEDMGNNNSLYGLALATREWLLCRMEHLFHGTGREILMGLLLGERAVLSLEVEDVFNKSGTAHLLTVSGFHISIMAGGIYWLLQKLGFRPKTTAILTIPLIFWLAMVEGMTVSILRAAVMSTLFYFASILERDYDGLSAWGFAVLMTLLSNPALLFSRSFLLSYSAVLGILLFQKKIWNFFVSLIPAPISEGFLMGLYRRILELFSMTLAANCLSLPFLLYFFGYIPVISLISSVVVFPLLPSIMGTAAAAIFCPIGQLADGIGTLAQLLAEGLYRILLTLSELDWIIYGQSDFLLGAIIIFCVMILLLRLWNMGQRHTLYFLTSFVFLFWVSFGIYAGMIPVQAELISCRSSMVLTYQGRAVIIGSPEKTADLREIEKVLNGAHVKAVDTLLVTRTPRDDGITVLELSKRWNPAMTASSVELDAFELTNTPYRQGHHPISFWNIWTLNTTDDGAVLSNGRRTVAKLHSQKETADVDALLYDKYAFAFREDMDWSFTWDNQLKLGLSAR